MRAAAGSARPYDLAIIGVEVPAVQGAELASAIRATPVLRSTRILLLTPWAGGREAATNPAADGFVRKPVRRSRLYDEIAKCIGAPGSKSPVREAPATASEHDEAPSAWPLVLVAEDNKVNQLVAVKLLQRRGFRTEVAGNGREALDMFERGDYHAVFMDCQMPELDGYQATAEIRRREGPGRRVPIIAMTAMTMKGDREQCLAAGMDDYVSKSVRREDLDEVIARALGGGGEETSPRVGSRAIAGP